jgi:hypothetical protein
MFNFRFMAPPTKLEKKRASDCRYRAKQRLECGEEYRARRTQITKAYEKRRKSNESERDSRHRLRKQREKKREYRARKKECEPNETQMETQKLCPSPSLKVRASLVREKKKKIQLVKGLQHENQVLKKANRRIYKRLKRLQHSSQVSVIKAHFYSCLVL